MTITGAQLDSDRAAAFEKTLEGHKKVIEDLEKQLEAAKSGGVGIAASEVEVIRLNGEVSELKAKLERTEEQMEEMKMEKERRALRGEFDPTTTRILHFK